MEQLGSDCFNPGWSGLNLGITFSVPRVLPFTGDSYVRLFNECLCPGNTSCPGNVPFSAPCACSFSSLAGTVVATEDKVM